eukprot:6191250-Pleurochrysis_carterae.AAC.2
MSSNHDLFTYPDEGLDTLLPYPVYPGCPGVRYNLDDTSPHKKEYHHGVPMCSIDVLTYLLTNLYIVWL